MPSIDEEAKAFEMALAARFGRAVKARRRALKLSASEVSRRTAELGYPISRGAIAKIESNSRSGKVDVAELLALSAALDIPPVLLLFDGFPSGQPVEVRPGFEAMVGDAVRWVWGRISYPRKVARETNASGRQVVRAGYEDRPRPPNDGVNLITAATAWDKAVADRIPLMILLEKVQTDDGDVNTAQRMLDLHDEQIEALQNQIHDTREALWGTSTDTDEPEESEDESDD
jgi:transcriptional regulator with XRE-family HTH domain